MSDRRGRRNRMRELLDGDGLLVGAFITMSDPTAVDIAALSGHDFILIDSEHAGLSLETIANHVRAARARDLGTMIRVPEGDYGYIQRALDVGVDGVEVPHVKDAADARRAVASVRFPPEGARGMFTKGVAAEFGAHGYSTVGELTAAVNADIICNAIIEDVEGVENIEEILAVPGLDFVSVGPGDLSGSLGVPGQTDHPSVRAAIEKVLAACREARIPAHTTAAAAPPSAQEIRAAGLRVLTSASDAMNLLVGMRADVEAARRESRNPS
jgi:2-keto-3-deoxy-L-rhamnonate aldolase RhmA